MSDEPPPDAKCPHCGSFLCCGDAKDAAAYAVVARNACVQLGLTEADLEGGALARLVETARNYARCARSNHLSPYVAGNGLRGGSPWAEFVEAVDALTPPKEAPDA